MVFLWFFHGFLSKTKQNQSRQLKNVGNLSKTIVKHRRRILLHFLMKPLLKVYENTPGAPGTNSLTLRYKIFIKGQWECPCNLLGQSPASQPTNQSTSQPGAGLAGLGWAGWAGLARLANMC
jgi:hypothetical protein